jgi:hypothetical protein
MIIVACMFCGMVTKVLDDGRPDRRLSHSYCPKHWHAYEIHTDAADKGFGRPSFYHNNKQANPRRNQYVT